MTRGDHRTSRRPRAPATPETAATLSAPGTAATAPGTAATATRATIAKVEAETQAGGQAQGGGQTRSGGHTRAGGEDQAGARPRTRTRARPAASEDDVPLILDRYRLQRQLGAGAFGTVWRARDERLEREVAVKIVPRERIVGGRFEREARAAARLAHPGIVTLYEAGADDDGAYLVSELVRGATLGELLEAGRLSDQEIITIGIAMCDALAHAHSEHVVHRDVKPSNILVPDRPATAAEVAKLTDFGVARIAGGDTLTHTGDVVGTAAYMAPEQAAGRDAGPEADLYALALVLYEALTGVNPVRAAGAGQRGPRLGVYLPSLRRQRRELPRELGRAIDQALRPRSGERGSVGELRVALAAAVAGASDVQGVVAPAWDAARDPTPPEPFGQPSAPPPLPPPARARAPARAWTPGSASGAEDPGAEPPGGDPGAEPLDLQPGSYPRVPALPRAQNAAAAAGVVAWLIVTLAPSTALAPLIGGLAAALATAAAPRIGWLAVLVVLATWLSLAGHTGAMVLVVLGGLVPIVLMPRRGSAWGLAAAAPALGAVALAGAWPALAGRTRGVLTRAALGAVGYVWTLAGSALAGADLYVRVHSAPITLPSPRVWTPSTGAALHHVLVPLLTDGALAPAVAWGLAAAILPWVVRGRHLPLDFVLASAWAAATVAGTYQALRIARGPLASATVHGAVLGGVAALAVALAPSLPAAVRAGRAAARVP